MSDICVVVCTLNSYELYNYLKTNSKMALLVMVYDDVSLCQLSNCLFTTRQFYMNTIVHGDIEIYRSNIKTLDFFEKLYSASVMLFAPQLNQAPWL